MKKKILAVFLSLCMAMSLLPVTALATEDTETTSAPAASGNNFFANGTPITITATEPAGGTKAEVGTGFTATGKSAYISWDDKGTTKYVGVSEKVSIYGGGDGRTTSVTLPSTSITMTGGTVWNLFGGNYGEETADKDFCSTVEGNVNISLSGPAVVKNLLHGAGARNTCVKGTITMTFDGVDLSSNKTNMLYVNGGSWGNGNEGTRNIESGAMSTDAVANKVVINATNSKFYLLGGGGSGSTKVKDADVTLTDCEVNYLYLSGINGEVEKSSIVATDCTIGSFSATNRGFVGTGNVDLNGCTVEKLNTGAAEGCFTSDSGETDGSGVTGSCVWDLDENTEVVTAQLTPLVIKNNGSWQNTYKNLTVKKAGDPLDLKVTSFDANANGSATQDTFMVPEGSTLTLNNVQTTIDGDNTLTNAGTIDMVGASSLTVASGATLEQAGTVSGTVVVDKGGTITKYVARVGNTGYKTLAAALAAAGENDTITLLADITNNNVGTTAAGADTVLNINKSITIKGNGNEISINLSVPNTFGDRDQVFSIGEDKDSEVEVTLDNVKMTVTGKDGGKGDAFDVWGTLNITNGSNITVKNAQSAFTMQGGENAKVNIDKASTVTANNIHGNFSNGGIWTIKEGSSLDINTAGNHGLSVEELTVNASTVSVDGAAYTGILAATVTLENDANVTVTNCGKDLPQESQWAPDKESYKNAMELKGETPTLTVDNSTLTLTNNVNKDGTAINSIYLGKGTLTQKNNPTINVDKIVTSDEATTQYYVVTYMSNGEKWDSEVVNTGSVALPEIPDQGYNHFVGWNDGSKTHDAGAQVTISKDTTFTAVWSYIPPANPNYRIDIPAAEGGTVTADPAAAKAGATVTLTATPDEGYAVGTITVTDRFGDAVKVTENADGTYTFTMPNGQVTVKATFVETEEPAPAEPFPDVDENDWFYDEVVYVYENGLMNGVENNQFAPNTATNRAMLATILYRLAGQPDVSGDLPFTDVAAGTWYTDAVLWAAQNGIVNGLGENTFAPMNTLTREQLVTMLYRYAEAEGYDVSAAADLSGYPDADKVQTYAQEAMTWAVAEGIVEGMDGNLNPAGNATRAQIATILMRFCEGVAK